MRKLFKGGPQRIALIVVLAVMVQACQPSDIHQIKVKLDDAAKILNTAAHSNHDLYGAGTYGAVGSPQAIATRQKVATGIHIANGALIEALNVAKTLTPSTQGAGKAQILEILQGAAAALAAVHTGNQKIDVVLQTAAALVNDAIILTTALKG